MVYFPSVGSLDEWRPPVDCRKSEIQCPVLCDVHEVECKLAFLSKSTMCVVRSPKSAELALFLMMCVESSFGYELSVTYLVTAS